MEEGELKSQSERLRSVASQHLVLAVRIMRADSSAGYPFDFFAVAVIRRSMSLIKGFCSLVEQRNYTCAAPLLRMQIDNCLRLHAGHLAKEMHEFTIHVMGGTHIRDIKDKSGKRMTDAHLVSSLGARYPWIPEMYEVTSGFVHLSDSHVFIAKDTRSTEDTGWVVISDTDDHLPVELFTRAIRAFLAATAIVFEYLGSWAWVKDNPGLAKEMRAMTEQEAKAP